MLRSALLVTATFLVALGCASAAQAAGSITENGAGFSEAMATSAGKKGLKATLPGTGLRPRSIVLKGE